MTADTRSRTPLVAVLGLLAGVVGRLAWLSWGFDDDHAYSVPQVVGCGVCAVVATIALVVFFRRADWYVAPLCLAVGLSGAWTIWARADDDTGLYAVGAVMMLVGTAVSLGLVGWVTRQVVARR